MNDIELAFVYGTLRKGQPNNRLLNGCEHYDTLIIKAPLKMYSLGAFPALVEDGGNSNPIVGDLYHINDTALLMMDRLEGIPHFYQREFIRIGSKLAWIYVMPKSRIPEGAGIIHSGDWGTPMYDVTRMDSHYEVKGEDARYG